jgi:hypothetical protein
MKPLTTTRTIWRMAATMETAILLNCSPDQVIAKFVEFGRKCERYSGPQSDLDDMKVRVVTAFVGWLHSRPETPTQGQ